MLISVDDTPFGHALGQFMLLFDQSPLDLAHAHVAFADLSALVAREHPERAWPITIPRGDGPSLSVTVEGMLALKRARYADLQPVALAAVEAAMAPWHGATVRAVTAERGNSSGSMLHVELKLPTGETQGLTAHCPWQVTAAGGRPCSWNEAVSPLQRAVSTLRRKKVASVRVQVSGALEVSFATGAGLLVGGAGWYPQAEVADLHYWLHTNDAMYLRVATQFLLQPLRVEDEQAEEEGAS
ncbi:MULTISPECIES: hypothetical protein [Hymenobacter]|uniref:Uncharacterized protein n=2 Tax=Hymenobacter TaxID=89966 RepID=A0A246FFW1_9BACT|nr:MULTISPECIES: hypothetical protein [Hymenobacter]NVO86767.1 hypothetical protein [Hymenobacter terrestris]OWP61398.1 hypothetical protein CDA63_19590 [Hymenobacter amundsenii]